jgi:hypothetical protein
MLFGGLYEIRMDYVGAQVIPIADKQVQSDKITVTVKTASSEYKFDVFFARDAARTPLLVNAPLAMGKFSMELIH